MSDPVATWLRQFRENQERAQRAPGPRIVPLAELGREPGKEASDEMQDEPRAVLAPENEDESRQQLLARLNRERRTRQQGQRQATNRSKCAEWRGKPSPEPKIRPRQTFPRKTSLVGWSPADGPKERWAAAPERRQKKKPAKRFTKEDRDRARERRGKYHTRGWYSRQLLAVATGELTMTDQQFAALISFGRSKGWNKSHPKQR